jgi:hypothetical protein
LFGFRISLSRQNTEWEYIATDANFRLPDGSISQSLVMRRTVDGKYEYRSMTDIEVLDHYSLTAW